MSVPAIEVSAGAGPIGPAPFREAMSRFATGVVVLSTGGARPHGMTANAFSSVSLAPPTALCCVAHDAVMHGAIQTERRFAVSVLSSEQEPLARHFAAKERPLGKAQFNGIGWEPGPDTGAPLLHGALAWMECRLAGSHISGDHSVFIGEVLNAGVAPGGDGLLFFNGGFGRAAAD